MYIRSKGQRVGEGPPHPPIFLNVTDTPLLPVSLFPRLSAAIFCWESPEHLHPQITPAQLATSNSN